MAIYNQLVFCLLCVEIVTFLILILPLPFKARRAMFKLIAESPLVAQVQYCLKIVLIFVSILFVDSVNQMRKVHLEASQTRLSAIKVENDYRSRKFLSERNFYLMSFTLFLSLSLSRTYSLIFDLISAQEEVLKLKAGHATPSAADVAKSKQSLKGVIPEADETPIVPPSDKKLD